MDRVHKPFSCSGLFYHIALFIAGIAQAGMWVYDQYFYQPRHLIQCCVPRALHPLSEKVSLSKYHRHLLHVHLAHTTCPVLWRMTALSC